MPSAEFSDWWASFRVSGDICPLRLGMTRDQLKAVLGEPDAVGGESRKYPEPAIWKYDELEFHFEQGQNGKLWLIYREVDDVPAVSLRVM